MTQIDKDTTFKLSIKDAAGLGFVLVSVLSVYFTLKADIALAMEKPEPVISYSRASSVFNVSQSRSEPVISEQEYHYKDEIVRKTIMLTQQDVDAMKEDVKEIKETLKTLEARLYEKRR